MQINPFAITAALANPSAGVSASSSTQSSNTSNPARDANNMFMTLLSAQLKNQTPFDPVDPMQFTNELVQFNMLDQLAQINNTLQQISAAPVPSGPANGNSISTTSGGK